MNEKQRQMLENGNQPTRSDRALAARTPALDTLGSQLDNLKQNMFEATDELLAEKYGEIRDGVRDRVLTKTQEVATEPDFFGFGELFETIETPAIEVLTD